MESSIEVNDIEFPPGVKDLSSDMNPSEMVKALKKCCKFFSQLEQDEEEIKQQYLPFCQYIVQDEFLKEAKDQNCQIHIGCILADVFRLHAPENPFRSAEKVKEIFMFLTDQLKHLKDSKGTLFPKAYHILENVATIKSYNICIDLDDAVATSEIFCYLFKTLFSIVNSGHDKQLQTHMLDIMGFAITDGGSVPQPLLDVILECLLEKTRKMNSTAYELARDLLRRTSNVIEQFLMLFFQNIILSNKQDSSKLSSKWTKLIPELYKITPTLLLNTLPQLELKLRVDDPKERLQVVQLLSQMFSEKDSNLASENSTLWNCFLGRFNDIDSEVRATCVTFCRDLIINHGRESSLSKEVVGFFKPRRHDPEENVRIAVVSCIRGIALYDLRLASDELLEFLKERMLDKKWRVRESVIKAMADIYKKYTVGENTSKIFLRRLSSFKSKLLHVYYRQNIDDCMLLERVLVSSLVPYTLSNKERMKHLLELYATVDDHAVKSFIEILKKQRYLRAALKDILSSLNLANEEEQNKNILSKVMNIASQMPGNLQHARENISKFIQIIRQDPKMLQWVAYIVGEKYVSQKVAVAVRDLLKKLESEGATKALKSMTQQLLERIVIVPVLIDQMSMKLLFELVKESLDSVSDIDELNSENAKRRSIELLKNLSLLAPYLFSSAECFEDLLSFLRRTRDEEVVQHSLIILEHTGYMVEENFPEIRSVLLLELKNKAKTGTPAQVKHAIFCLNKFTSVRETPLMQIFDFCKDHATAEGNASSTQMESVLTALGCIAEVLPERAATQLRSVIASVVVKQVIMKTTSSSNLKGKKKELKWCEKSELGKETKTKIAGMKCIVRWLHGLRSNESDCCGSTLRLLQHMLHNEGDLMKSGGISKAEMAHLRLEAAYCVLKIARIIEYKELFKPEIYQELTMLINDSVLEVRKNFLNKLYKNLFRFQIHVSFLALFAMVSQEILKEQREQGTFLYHQLIKRNREFSKQNPAGSKYLSTMMPEYMLPFLIYLLANDPDFLEGISKKSLARIKDCIHFILDPLLTKDHPESFGFIKRLAENLKRTKVAEKPDDTQRNENIYAVCDLTVQHVLQRSGVYAVALIEPADSSVAKFIPGRLFTPPSGPENNKIYLPREFYSNVKHIPTLTSSSSSSLSSDKFRRNLPSAGPRRMLETTVKTSSAPVRLSSQSTTSTTQSSSPAFKQSSATSSSSLLTPPTSSQTSTSSESAKPTPSTQPVRTSGRKRKARNLSPPLPSTSPQKKLQQEKKKEDQDSENETSVPPTPVILSKRSKTIKKSETAGKKVAPLVGNRNVIASASVRTAPRKTLGVSNGQSKVKEGATVVRRSNRKRGK